MGLRQVYQQLNHRPGFIGGLLFFVLALALLTWGGM